MELIRGLHNIRNRHRGCVATIGNFDGVHLGHRAILDQLVRRAVSDGVASVAVCFEPQPQEFFAGVNAPPRLTRFREKMLALSETHIDRVLVLRFDHAFSELGAHQFARQVLVDGLGVRHLVIGDDFRFGHNGEGNFVLLCQMGPDLGFSVQNRATHMAAGGRVSSSWIRDALANGELSIATELLGRPYAISGRVVHGRKLGRSIGFPTANVSLRRLSTPLRGVFAVRVIGVSDTPWPGVANLGKRPTVDGITTVLEVHLFDLREDLYGRHIKVEFVRRIRDERRFETIEELKRQITIDAGSAREILHVPQEPALHPSTNE